MARHPTERQSIAKTYLTIISSGLANAKMERMLYVNIPKPEQSFEEGKRFGAAIMSLVDCGILKFELGEMSIPPLGHEFLQFVEETSPVIPTPQLAKALYAIETDVRLKPIGSTKPIGSRAASVSRGKAVVKPHPVVNFWTLLMLGVLLLGLFRLIAGPK